ncbi:MAG: tetratricopeptide repeat protein, partial [Bacteroidia bacterium]
MKMKACLNYIILYLLLLQGLSQILFAQTNSPVLTTNTLIKSTACDTSGVNILFRQSTEIYQKDPLTAIQYCLNARDICEKINYLPGKAEAYAWLGFLYHEQGQVQEALNDYHMALRIQEEIKDKPGMATTLNNIGSIYMDQRRPTEEREYYNRSLKIQEEIGNKEGVAIALNNIGLTYNNQQKNNEALTFYFRALNIWEELNIQNGVATTLTNIGAIKRQQG